MRKAKITGEVAFMEVSHQSSLGVCTRARTLALQRASSPTPAHAPAPTSPGPDSGSYIQLRSRRLEKPPAVPSRPAGTREAVPKPGAAAKAAPPPKSPRARSAASSVNSGPVVGSASKGCSRKGGREEQLSEASLGDDDVEASFGENVMESEDGDRNVRETTPCSSIRDSESVGTPGSTTRPRPTSSRRTQSLSCWNIPTTDEMEGFFVGPEKLQQRAFVEKYNFDPVNDCPLPGRYEWVKLDS